MSPLEMNMGHIALHACWDVFVVVLDVVLLYIFSKAENVSVWVDPL